MTKKAETSSMALVDIGLLLVASALAFAVELLLADQLPWGAESRGIVAVLTGAAVALALTRVRGRKLTDLGFRRPRRWATVPLWVLGIMVTFIAAQALVPAVLAPIFDLPAPDLSRYDHLRGNLPAALAMGVALPLFAAVPEEIVYRGFLIERLGKLVGESRPILAVLLQAVIFGAIHFQWGLGGVLMTTIMGAVWGFAFLLCGRNLWIVILAHSAAHVALVMQLYAG